MPDLRAQFTALQRAVPTPADVPPLRRRGGPITTPIVAPPAPEPAVEVPAVEPVVEAGDEGSISSLVNSVFKSANPDHTVRFDMVDLGVLTIDPDIQRPENKALINAIAREFDINAFGVATGSVRVNPETGDETIVTVDGQQRTRGAIKAGWDGKVPMQLHYGLTRAEEAALFRRLNFKRSVTAINLFRAAIVEGDEKVISIVEALEELDIPFSTAKGFTAVAVARRLANRKGGMYHFRWALLTVRAIYDTDGKGGVYDGRIVEAFARFHEKYEKRILDDELRSKLMKMPGGLAGLIGHAETVRQNNNSRPMLFNFIDAIVLRYNFGKHKDGRNMLPLWDKTDVEK